MLLYCMLAGLELNVLDFFLVVQSSLDVLCTNYFTKSVGNIDLILT